MEKNKILCVKLCPLNKKGDKILRLKICLCSFDKESSLIKDENSSDKEERKFEDL